MYAPQEVSEATRRALISVEKVIREKALKLNLNGSTESFVKEQIERIAWEYYGVKLNRS